MRRKKDPKNSKLGPVRASPELLMSVHGTIGFLQAAMLAIRNRERISRDDLSFLKDIAAAYEKRIGKQQDAISGQGRSLGLIYSLRGLELAYQASDESWEARVNEVIHYVESIGIAKLTEEQKNILRAKRAKKPAREPRKPKALASHRFYEAVARHTLGTSRATFYRHVKALEEKSQRIREFLRKNPIKGDPEE